MMALAASALAANASFTEMPVTAGQASVQMPGGGLTADRNFYQPAPNNLSRYSDPLEISGGATPRSTVGVVPEPTTLVAGALLLLPLGMSAVRIMRRGKLAPVNC